MSDVDGKGSSAMRRERERKRRESDEREREEERACTKMAGPCGTRDGLAMEVSEDESEVPVRCVALRCAGDATVCVCVRWRACERDRKATRETDGGGRELER